MDAYTSLLALRAVLRQWRNNEIEYSQLIPILKILVPMNELRYSLLLTRSIDYDDEDEDEHYSISGLPNVCYIGKYRILPRFHFCSCSAHHPNKICCHLLAIHLISPFLKRKKK